MHAELSFSKLPLCVDSIYLLLYTRIEKENFARPNISVIIHPTKYQEKDQRNKSKLTSLRDG
jgi:hypothetical protein